MNFCVGQKVVCIDAAPIIGTRGGLLIEGNIYTISAIGEAFAMLFVGLEETPRRSGPLHWEARRFRPVVENKTDITVFTEILDRENAKPREVERA